MSRPEGGGERVRVWSSGLAPGPEGCEPRPALRGGESVSGCGAQVLPRDLKVVSHDTRGGFQREFPIRRSTSGSEGVRSHI